MNWWIVGSEGLLASSLKQVATEHAIAWVATGRSEVDITDKSAVLAFAQRERPTHIINTAAYTDVDKAETDVESAFAVNADGAAHVAMAAQESGGKLIHISTDYVFDGKKRMPYVEEDLCAPLNVYGQSKLAGEEKVLSLFPDACVIRTSWLFGKQGSLVARLQKMLQEQEEIQMVTDQVGTPTFVKDLAEAIVDLQNASGLFHFSNQGGASRYQIALDLWQWMKTLGLPVRTQAIHPVTSDLFPTRARRPAYSILDTTHYTAQTGKQPAHWLEAFTRGVL